MEGLRRGGGSDCATVTTRYYLWGRRPEQERSTGIVTGRNEHRCDKRQCPGVLGAEIFGECVRRTFASGEQYFLCGRTSLKQKNLSVSFHFCPRTRTVQNIWW